MPPPSAGASSVAAVVGTAASAGGDDESTAPLSMDASLMEYLDGVVPSATTTEDVAAAVPPRITRQHGPPPVPLPRAGTDPALFSATLDSAPIASAARLYTTVLPLYRRQHVPPACPLRFDHDNNGDTPKREKKRGREPASFWEGTNKFDRLGEPPKNKRHNVSNVPPDKQDLIALLGAADDAMMKARERSTASLIGDDGPESTSCQTGENACVHSLYVTRLRREQSTLLSLLASMRAHLQETSDALVDTRGELAQACEEAQRPAALLKEANGKIRDLTETNTKLERDLLAEKQSHSRLDLVHQRVKAQLKYHLAKVKRGGGAATRMRKTTAAQRRLRRQQQPHPSQKLDTNVHNDSLASTSSALLAAAASPIRFMPMGDNEGRQIMESDDEDFNGIGRETDDEEDEANESVAVAKLRSALTSTQLDYQRERTARLTLAREHQQQLDESLSQSRHEHALALEKLEEERNRQARTLRTKLNEIQARLDAAKHETSVVRNEYESKLNESRVRVERRARSEREAERAALQASMDAMRAQLDESRVLETSREARHEKEISELRAALDSSRVQAARVREEKEELVVRVREEKQELVVRIQETKSKHGTELQRIRAMLEQAKEEKLELEREHAKKRLELMKEHDEIVLRAQHNLDKTKGEVERVREERKSATEHLKQTREQLSTAHKELVAMKEQRENAMEQLNETRVELERVRAESLAKDHENDVVAAERERARADRERDLEKLEQARIYAAQEHEKGAVAVEQVRLQAVKAHERDAVALEKVRANSMVLQSEGNVRVAAATQRLNDTQMELERVREQSRTVAVIASRAQEEHDRGVLDETLHHLHQVRLELARERAQREHERHHGGNDPRLGEAMRQLYETKVELERVRTAAKEGKYEDASERLRETLVELERVREEAKAKNSSTGDGEDSFYEKALDDLNRRRDALERERADAQANSHAEAVRQLAEAKAELARLRRRRDDEQSLRAPGLASTAATGVQHDMNLAEALRQLNDTRHELDQSRIDAMEAARRTTARRASTSSTSSSSQRQRDQILAEALQQLEEVRMELKQVRRTVSQKRRRRERRHPAHSGQDDEQEALKKELNESRTELARVKNELRDVRGGMDQDTSGKDDTAAHATPAATFTRPPPFGSPLSSKQPPARDVDKLHAWYRWRIQSLKSVVKEVMTINARLVEQVRALANRVDDEKRRSKSFAELARNESEISKAKSELNSELRAIHAMQERRHAGEHRAGLCRHRSSERNGAAVCRRGGLQRDGKRHPSGNESHRYCHHRRHDTAVPPPSGNSAPRHVNKHCRHRSDVHENDEGASVSTASTNWMVEAQVGAGSVFFASKEVAEELGGSSHFARDGHRVKARAGKGRHAFARFRRAISAEMKE